jgi:D-alanine-D-alanine ligase-like ATP-grasp enzyme
MKNNIKIAIFAGGPSLEREISIKSAKNIKKNLEINFNNIIFVVVEKNLN